MGRTEKQREGREEKGLLCLFLPCFPIAWRIVVVLGSWRESVRAPFCLFTSFKRVSRALVKTCVLVEFMEVFCAFL